VEGCRWEKTKEEKDKIEDRLYEKMNLPQG
jgi:hypothetical protein